ncbi:DUF6377 domain-containing protein [Geofilum sp. OHC36d9]|uniref:DUF6377 domain-containing protein n=1 Tax=Geofilum sp. OHC36d9 TaxID=3458413 RepID=UPI004033DB05
MKAAFLIFLFFSIAISIHSETLNKENHSLLQTLDKELKNRKEYTHERETKIEYLKELLAESSTPEDVFTLQHKLYQEYQAFICDSAIYYLEKNLELTRHLNNDQSYYETAIRLAHLLSSSGMYKEAVDILDSIPQNKLTADLTDQLLSSYDHVYGELAFYSRSNTLKKTYNSIAKQYKEKLFQILDPSSDLYLSMKETRFRDSANIDSALFINNLRLKKLSEDDPGFALVAFHRSLDYNIKNEYEQRKKYLILSAISDTRSAIKDNASLTLLANILFEEGDINRAYNYIRYSMEDANFYNAKLRNVQISEIQPIIDRTYNIRSEYRKRLLRLFLFISVLLFIFSVLSLWIIYKQKRNLLKAHSNVQQINERLKTLNHDLTEVNTRLQYTNSSLAESNHVKEEYIGLFLSICSTYIDKMEGMRKMVSKEITHGRVAELLSFSKSGNFIDNELREFYANFDNTFLHLYPNFVDAFNNLLQPEEQIELKQGELLNTELRIFALIRLGITDSSKIAGLLRYSVNTIYNYRAKIKNKAKISRNDFEKQVQAIDSTLY